MSFQKALLVWFDHCGRDLPWRLSTDPYPVLLSEFMLQQTTVAAVVPYFQKWMRRFPDVESLAEAEEEDVLLHWAGLGYYSRGRRLHAVAKHVLKNGWPENMDALRELPGVGPYTTAAVGSIAFGWPIACVDGNVERVYSRMEVSASVGPALRREAQAWASEIMMHDRPGDWNQALMELGATICRPKAPRCHQCPVREHCRAYVGGEVGQYPVPKPKTQWVPVDHVIRVHHCQGAFGLRKAPEGAWWAGLWVFDGNGLAHSSDVELLGEFNHTVTRHKIRVTVEMAHVHEKLAGLHWCDATAVESTFALPGPHRRALQLALVRLGLGSGQPTLFNRPTNERKEEEEHKAVQA